MVVVAVYRVHDNGDKVVKRLSRGRLGPALDSPNEAPAPETPPGPPGVTTPTGNPTNKADFEAPCARSRSRVTAGRLRLPQGRDPHGDHSRGYTNLMTPLYHTR